nr:SprT family zinc-dependent metalloprotease [uncultured Cohaesibacter sp.]
MNTNNISVNILGLDVQVTRKKIKNLHLSVCPPDGRIKLSCPIHFDEERVRLAIISRLPWIRQRQQEFQNQPRQSERKYVDGESHYFRGQRYRLKVIENSTTNRIQIVNNSILRMEIRKSVGLNKKEQLLQDWYRCFLKKETSALFEKWQPRIQKEASGWRIQKMKTKWGSCNTTTGHILINLELAKKSPECLEYIVVHELVHLHERHHNDRFKSLMNEFLPSWQLARDKLKAEPLAYEHWEY